MLSASVVALVLPSLVVTTVHATPASPPRCTVVDSIGRCLVSAVDPGRRGAGEPKRRSREQQTPRPRTPERPRQVAAGEPTGPPAPPPPPPVKAVPGGAGPSGGWTQRPVQDLSGLIDVPTPDEPQTQAPAVSPEILAQRAIKELPLPTPVLHASTGDRGFVGVPMWLWIDGGPAAAGPISATATAGAASVTATARLSEVEWAMGPPGENVRCSGPGTPWTGQEGPSPDCGYTYLQRSLPARTAGAGRWTITATSVWTVTWSGASNGGPVTGEQVVRIPNQTTLAVDEVQVLVGGDGA